MKENEKKEGLGKIIYMEWLIPLFDYYGTLRKNEVIFEVIIPAVIAMACSMIYLLIGKLFIALNGIADVMPTAISILIGFTVMLITILLTSTGSGIETLKDKDSDRKLRGKNVKLYQLLHIQFSHSLLSEIFLLLLIFFYLFLYGLGVPKWAGEVILIIEIYLILNTLLSILRGVTNLYFSFFKPKEK